MRFCLGVRLRLLTALAAALLATTIAVPGVRRGKLVRRTGRPLRSAFARPRRPGN